MKFYCPNSGCQTRSAGTSSPLIIRKGSYFRKSDGQTIPRFRCKRCGTYFSSARFTSRYRQKKRQLNHQLKLLFCSGVSQRRAARILRINEKTSVRKFRFLANEARIEQTKFLRSLPKKSIQYIQFDDLETAEHSKCKPLSVALAVEPETRKVLGFQASRMPARGMLAKIAFQKYGPRKDERPLGWKKLFESLAPLVTANARFLSDQNPHYPRYLKNAIPGSDHRCVKGQRGCIAGQGELKKIGFDPLFSLNHTCAMFRANMNRLFRKTWCTTKTIQGLEDHLAIFVAYHNRELTRPIRFPVSGAG